MQLEVSRQPRRLTELYLGSAAVFLASSAATWLLPLPELFRGLASISAVGALLNVVFTLWREERAHERAVELQQRQQDFALATASHMANVAYDKHVKFCEAYIERTNRGLGELMRSGPSKEALQFAGDLADIREEHATWLTAELESKLMPFEAALREMGAADHLLDTLPVGERRTRVVDEIYKSFGIIVGAQNPRNDEDAAIASAQIVDHLRDVLGIKELTHLRLSATRLVLARVSDGRGAR